MSLQRRPRFQRDASRPTMRDCLAPRGPRLSGQQVWLDGATAFKVGPEDGIVVRMDVHGVATARLGMATVDDGCAGHLACLPVQLPAKTALVPPHSNVPSPPSPPQRLHPNHEQPKHASTKYDRGWLLFFRPAAAAARTGQLAGDALGRPP